MKIRINFGKYGIVFDLILFAMEKFNNWGYNLCS